MSAARPLRWLQQISHYLVGRLEKGCAHQHLQLLDGHTVGFGSVETGHYVLDFLVLGEADLRRDLCGLLEWGFFFTSICNWARVCSTTC